MASEGANSRYPRFRTLRVVVPNQRKRRREERLLKNHRNLISIRSIAQVEVKDLAVLDDFVKRVCIGVPVFCDLRSRLAPSLGRVGKEGTEVSRGGGGGQLRQRVFYDCLSCASEVLRKITVSFA